MARRSNPLDEILRDALDESITVSSTFRKLIAFGGEVGSTSLREWASLELSGYLGKGQEIPEYRIPSAIIQVDAVNGQFKITGQHIGTNWIPEEVRDEIHEAVPLGQPVAEIEAMLKTAEDSGHIHLTLPEAQTLLAIMNERNSVPGQRLTAIYWSVAPSALSGTLDQIRTKLVELLSEMKAGMPDSEELPSADLADQAVQLVVRGEGNRINITQSSAEQRSNSSVNIDSSESEKKSIWWTIGAVAVGIATVVAAIVGVAQWQNWGLGI